MSKHASLFLQAICCYDYFVGSWRRLINLNHVNCSVIHKVKTIHMESINLESDMILLVFETRNHSTQHSVPSMPTGLVIYKRCSRSINS